jgi:hypothetical protein
MKAATERSYTLIWFFARWADSVLSQLLTVDFGQGSDVSAAAVEVQPLVVTGPAANRVDIVFFSDGCKSNA